MNIKGIRERKLLESLRKCRDRLKLRKSAATKSLTMRDANESADVEMSERPALLNLACRDEESKEVCCSPKSSSSINVAANE